MTHRREQNAWISDTGVPDLVSVIIPTYNRAKYITDALDSVRSQDYRPLEIIVADDGSRDETEQVVRAWQSASSSEPELVCRYIRKENGGAASARNRGTRESRGSYLIYLDSDDALLPGILSKAVSVLSPSPLPYLFFRIQVADLALRPVRNAYIGQDFSGTENDSIDYLWHTMGAVYRRPTIAAAGPWLEILRAVEDWEYHTRIKLMGFHGRFEPDVGGLYRDHDDARLNVYRFNRDYICNVEEACRKIVAVAAEHNRLSSFFKRKIALRLLIHAVELGMHGCREDRKRLSNQAVDLLSDAPICAKAARLVEKTDVRLVHMLFWKINRLRLRKKRVVESPARSQNRALSKQVQEPSQIKRGDA